MLKGGWKKVRLGEVCEKITDGSHWSPKSSANGIPMVSVKDMTDFGFNIKIAKRISIENYKKLVKNDCKPLIHDVLIAKDGSYLKHIFVWREDIDIALLSSIAILRPDLEIIYPEFLKYTLQSPDVKNMMKNYVTGAALPRIILEDFKNFEIEIPPLPIQRKIAAILSAYDDLIENNTSRIQILEEMVQTFYKEWFVKFRFPGHEKVKMVDSELGMIPEGWGVKRLEDVCNIVMGQSPKSEFYNDTGDGLPFHQGVTNFGDRFPIDRMYCTVQNRIAEAGDILFSVRAPVGRINIADKKIVIGRGLCAIRSRSGNQAFVFQQLKEQFKEEDTMGSGTIFKSVTKDDMYGLKILVPPETLLNGFEEIIAPIFAELKNLIVRNVNLRHTRDLLLPKLISSEVDIESIDISTRSYSA